MAKYYNQGLGIVDTSSVTTSSGDELAKAANYTYPAYTEYADYTWENKPISDRVDALVSEANAPILSSPYISIITPSGSIHYIYDSTNTVTVEGSAAEHNDADYSLAYALTGVTSATGTITAEPDWSFVTPYLEFGNTIVRATITSEKGPVRYDTVTISRTPTLSPIVVVTTPATETYNIYDSTNTVDFIGTASDPNSLSLTLSYELSGDTTGSGTPTGTTAWNFTTPSLEFGNTRVDVNATNTWDLSGSDNVVISRTPTLSPTLTITTETSATTATEITIQGTASDPNSLPLTVTYEQSGAKTDSGTATGTTAWSFTETLSSGNNRFDVTATNNYSLTGTDYLIVNQSAAAAVEWEDTFHYDGFGDGVIHANWTQVTDGTIDEGGGDLTMETNADGNQEIYQTLSSQNVIFDVWGELEIDNSINDINARWRWEETGGADQNYFFFEIEEDYGDITLYCWSRNGATPSQTSFDMGSSYNMYLRMRYRPDLGDTYIRGFRSTTLPTEEGDWTEMTPATNRAVPGGQGGNAWYFRLQSNNNNGISSHTDTFYDCIKWPSVLFVYPDGDVSDSIGKFGSGTGNWDRLNSGIYNGTPDDSNGIVGLDGDNCRLSFESPSFGSSCSQIKVHGRWQGTYSDGSDITLYADGVNSDGTQQVYPDGSFHILTKTFNVSYTAATLANMEIHLVLNGSGGSEDDWLSELEVEIVL